MAADVSQVVRRERTPGQALPDLAESSMVGLRRSSNGFRLSYVLGAFREGDRIEGAEMGVPCRDTLPDAALQDTHVQHYRARAITAHDVAAAEMNWFVSWGKPASKYDWNGNPRDLTNHDPSSS